MIAGAATAAPVRLAREVGEHVDRDVRHRLAQRLHHVEAVALVEVQVEHHGVGPRREDGVHRLARAGGVADYAHAGNGAEQRLQA